MTSIYCWPAGKSLTLPLCSMQLSPGGGVAKGQAAFYGLNFKLEFACAQCWQAGLKSLPDKALKYCSSRARHTWASVPSLPLSCSLRLMDVHPDLVSPTAGGLKTDCCCWSHHWKEQNGFRSDLCRTPSRSLTTMKYVRSPSWPLPLSLLGPNVHTHAVSWLSVPFTTFSLQMCTQILKKKKCSYPGNCTFAHSREEREMWMYMKSNDREFSPTCLFWPHLSVCFRCIKPAFQTWQGALRHLS